MRENSRGTSKRILGLAAALLAALGGFSTAARADDPPKKSGDNKIQFKLGDVTKKPDKSGDNKTGDNNSGKKDPAPKQDDKSKGDKQPPKN